MGWTGRPKHLPFVGSLLKCLQQQGLGQAARQKKSRSPVGAITQVPGEDAEQEAEELVGCGHPTWCHSTCLTSHPERVRLGMFADLCAHHHHLKLFLTFGRVGADEREFLVSPVFVVLEPESSHASQPCCLAGSALASSWTRAS